LVGWQLAVRTTMQAPIRTACSPRADRLAAAPAGAASGSLPQQRGPRHAQHQLTAPCLQSCAVPARCPAFPVAAACRQLARRPAAHRPVGGGSRCHVRLHSSSVAACGRRCWLPRPILGLGGVACREPFSKEGSLPRRHRRVGLLRCAPSRPASCCSRHHRPAATSRHITPYITSPIRSQLQARTPPDSHARITVQVEQRQALPGARSCWHRAAWHREAPARKVPQQRQRRAFNG
jgi:hypothetical protein